MTPNLEARPGAGRGPNERPPMYVCQHCGDQVRFTGVEGVWESVETTDPACPSRSDGRDHGAVDTRTKEVLND
ncbi:hypothetical protein PSD17_66490 [Pseudonocardia sp. D17]|nr:hypothetical protein PSD17_66490 [Pseudonocardia sp. D17]